MRPEDLRDYRALRLIATNSWEIVRFRKTHRPGRDLVVQLRQRPALVLRGGHADFHMFHRIWLRDEYRLGTEVDRGLGCVIDLGANVGLFTARAAQLAERVIAYEPAPENFRQLECNTRELSGVERVRAAVAGEPCVLRLYPPQNPALSGVHSLYPERGAYLSQDSIEVQAIGLDDVLERHAIAHCDLLKLDVEGAEYDILYGAAPDTLARIGRIYGEYHDIGVADPRTRIGALAAFLRERGFALELVPHRRKPNHGNFFATRPGAVASA